jgi:hypothetical protein
MEAAANRAACNTRMWYPCDLRLSFIVNAPVRRKGYACGSVCLECKDPAPQGCHGCVSGLSFFCCASLSTLNDLQGALQGDLRGQTSRLHWCRVCDQHSGAILICTNAAVTCRFNAYAQAVLMPAKKLRT